MSERRNSNTIVPEVKAQEARGYSSRTPEIITPDCNQYASARQLWNRANDLYPEAIIYCNNEAEVKKAIAYARSNGNCIRIRTGGHNYSGYSSGNGVVVIDISNMNKIEINSCNNTVKVQGGALLGQIYNLLGSKGYPFPGGSCATVGISGVVSGGGWGYSSRYLGLASDSVTEVTVINEKCRNLVANCRKNADLFWAIRGGGGGNFGVITSLTFNLPAKVDLVTCFTIQYTNPDPDTEVQFLDIWQNWIINAPNTINMKASLVNSATEGKMIVATGLLYGTPQELEGLLAVFSVLPGYQLSYNYVSFLQAFQIITSVYPPYEYFIPYARFVSKIYPIETLQTLVERINGDLPLGSKMVQLNVYGLGGKVQTVGPQDTAYYYRDSSYIVLFETIFENNETQFQNWNWVEQNAQYLYGITSGSYINFPYRWLPDYLCDYYGGNLKCLQEIKRKYDPGKLFEFPQSI